MKIIVDMMGGDNAPLAVLEGAAAAVKEYGVQLIGVGDEALVRKTAADNNISLDGIEPHTTEGFDSKNWVLLDYSSVIVHVFVPNTRTYYDLEHLWADGEPIDISEYLTPDNSL